jgi:hypothetical protein
VTKGGALPRILSIVTAGLDPAVHSDSEHMRRCPMDCRVKPGNDEIEDRSRDASAPEFCKSRHVKREGEWRDGKEGVESLPFAVRPSPLR